MSPVRLRARAALALATIAAACTTAPPPPAPEPPAPIVLAPLPSITCPACVDQGLEISRLKQDLASREAELRDLRSSQRDQVKVIQESTREVTRAKAKLRRLATQADAASYLAEVEVALKALRATLPPSSAQPLLALAQQLLESAAAPFAQGDYAAAMDRAAQAEQLVTVVADSQIPLGTRARVAGEIPLQVSVPLKVAADTHLRLQPAPKARVVAILKKDAAVTAQAYKGAWLRVETDDGRAGWIAQAQLAAR
jgi:hypothetical protein